MKINVIGNSKGLGMVSHLTELLWRYKQDAYMNSINYDKFDVNLVLGLWHLRTEILWPRVERLC